MIKSNKRDRDNKDKSLLNKSQKNENNFSREKSRKYKYKGNFTELESEENYDDILLKSDITLKKIKEYKAKKERINSNEKQADEKITVISLLEALGSSFILISEKIFSVPKKACMLAARNFMCVLKCLSLKLVKKLRLIKSNFITQARLLLRDLKNTGRYINSCRQSKQGTIKMLLKYIKGGIKRYRTLCKAAVNTAIPAFAILAFMFTVNYWSSVTFALEVNYNDTSIGYISDEKVYEEAKAQVEDRMSTTKSLEIEEPTYELSLVPLNKLIDSEVLCDRIIENSKEDLVNASGIYIDDEFLCAVKNETDAMAVFDSILEPYEKDLDDENSFVDFVEKVEYVQGLFPNDEGIIWDAARLLDTLTQTKQEAVEYTVKEGDTIYDIALENDISIDELLMLNPDKEENLFVGDKLIISKEVNYIRVKVMKTETRNVEIDFKTEKENNPSMFKGTQKTVRKGEKGEESIKELVTYIDGVRVSSQELERERIKEPVNEKLEIGTKPKTAAGSGANVTISQKGFVWPAPACRSISSPFGWRTLMGDSNFHTGVDLIKAGAQGASKGAVIVASLDGTVESVRHESTGYGHSIVIDHGNGLKTRYAHCLEGSISVSVGQHVRAGQAIARVGKTGMATGYHLHFEVIINGDYVNPLKYIK